VQILHRERDLTDDGARGSARVFEPGDVVADGCPALPRGGCDTPRRSQILIEDHDDDAKDRIDLKFARNAPARERGEFGDPTAGATYVACVWEGGTLIAQLEAPAGPAWKTVKSRSYRYTDPTLASDGVKSVKIVAGSPGKPKETQAIVIGRGTNLPDPAVPLASPVFVTAQILDLGSGLCHRRHVHRRRDEDQPIQCQRHRADLQGEEGPVTSRGRGAVRPARAAAAPRPAGRPGGEGRRGEVRGRDEHRVLVGHDGLRAPDVPRAVARVGNTSTPLPEPPIRLRRRAVHAARVHS